MANVKCKIKKGMSGSKNGRSRWDNTEVLKNESKKTRRKEGKIEIATSLQNNYYCEFCGIYTGIKPKCNKCEKET